MRIYIPPFFLHWRKKWTKMKGLMKGCKGKYALKIRIKNRRDGYLLITQITKPMVAHRADRKRPGSLTHESLKPIVCLHMEGSVKGKSGLQGSNCESSSVPNCPLSSRCSLSGRHHESRRRRQMWLLFPLGLNCLGEDTWLGNDYN